MTNDNFYNSIKNIWDSTNKNSELDVWTEFCNNVDNVYLTDNTTPYIRIIWWQERQDMEEIFEELLDLGYRLKILNYTCFNDTEQECTIIVALHKK
jgi:hypothetical protein